MTKAQIKRRFRHFQKLLLLADWKINIEFGPLEHDEKADCDAKPEYREATIRLDNVRVPESEIDAYAVHELLHCVTWPLEKAAENWAGENESHYETIRDTAEDVVTKLERAFLNVVEKGK